MVKEEDVEEKGREWGRNAERQSDKGRQTDEVKSNADVEGLVGNTSEAPRGKSVIKFR